MTSKVTNSAKNKTDNTNVYKTIKRLKDKEEEEKEEQQQYNRLIDFITCMLQRNDLIYHTYFLQAYNYKECFIVFSCDIEFNIST